VYHIHTIDEVTQRESLGCVERISEHYRVPVLGEFLAQYPFRILGFHADNGSEYINRVGAEILEKLQIQLTKSRAQHTNDQAFMEGKNGSVVRNQMGYGGSPKKRQRRSRRSTGRRSTSTSTTTARAGTRPRSWTARGRSASATTRTSRRTRSSRACPRPSSSCGQGDDGGAGVARSHSDTEHALLVGQEKANLFRSFALPAAVP